jgi:Ca-activated chloride channel family protein
MRPVFALLILALTGASAVQAQGLLVPTQQGVPPLALSAQEVKVTIEDQVAVTQVVQTFRNPTSRALEATYIFPVPKGASVKKFTMWVDGKEVAGELVEADKARTIYTDIVNRTKDPGLLEYMGSNLLKVRVFPVPANGEQKLTVSYTSLANSDSGLIEYIYPLKADGNTVRNIEKFTLEATLKAQQPIQNVYSPTHAITVKRPNDREAVVRFDGKHETLDKDFQLYYSATAKDVGLTALMHRADSSKDGHFMLLISPRAELSKTQQVPRDIVFVLDTSGSMSGKRIEQAKKALKFCLRNLHENDRFNVIHFATVVTKYQDKLLNATAGEIEKAQKWVDELEATGATNIDEALGTALAMRPKDEVVAEGTSTLFPKAETAPLAQDADVGFHMEGTWIPRKDCNGTVVSYKLVSPVLKHNRNFTIVFFTDGQPTIGECSPEKIVKNVVAKNTADTRIFTFGVGDDVNAVLLDQLAEKTRSVATYVRESEDIEAKVSSFYAKISHPVMTNLKLSVKGQPTYKIEGDFRTTKIWLADPVAWKDIYPQQLPDLFHGSQLVMLGRYSGEGKVTMTLTGMVGDDKKEFTYDVNFPAKTNSDKAFVEDLWARRKVGYLLDQVRVNGESKEVKDEVISLAKKYGITTPYTSYLVVPDQAPRVAQGSSRLQFAPVFNIHAPQIPPANRPVGAVPDTYNQFQGAMPQVPISGEPAGVNALNGGTANTTGSTASDSTSSSVVPGYSFTNPVLGLGKNLPTPTSASPAQPAASAPIAYSSFNSATTTAQSGKEGVDLSLQLNELRNQERVDTAAIRQAAGRKCLNLNGVWTDEGFDAKLPVVKIKAQSEAYFRMLERHGEMKEVFQLGNRVVWVTPSRTVLVIDAMTGEERMSDADIDRLFEVKN